ncbi:MAG: hypothetical protein CBB82_04190 [Betaproteobacteria bacterium TMED22]|nr:MAG: hypothetical protein CBB82_04190 [Betaproteobacteria bacterium TMED22]
MALIRRPKEANMTNENKRTFLMGSYRIDIIVHGFPGKSVCHGPLGFSTIALIRHNNFTALVDVGGFGQRLILNQRLNELGVSPDEVTDVLLTHSHFDHAINWVNFPNANIYISRDEMQWALEQPTGKTYVPELYIAALQDHQKLVLIENNEEILSGIKSLICPGHTPGSTVYVLDTGDCDIVFTGDACKNRAELVSRAADMTYDAHLTKKSIADIWGKWSRRNGGILIPGHDLPMVLNNDSIEYIGKHEATIKAWFDGALNQTTLISLSPRN